MRRGIAFGLVSFAVAAAAGACSGSPGPGFQSDGGAGSGSGGGSGGSGSGGGSGGSGSGGIGIGLGDGGTQSGDDGGGNVITKTTIYANTDGSLYSMDPDTKAVTLIGPFAGLLDASAENRAVTDVAVNAEGDIYANSEQYIYKVVLPASGTGTVQLTNAQKKLNAGTTVYMYALAFAPPGLLGTGETLIGGDGNGEVWSINPATGNAKDLGNFGPDPSVTGNFLALSGDIVLYLDNGAATGLATIRSCAPPPTKYPNNPPTCSTTSDFLAGIDITELTNTYTSGTPSKSLNGGIYGGSSTASGPGTGFGELYGLGAWEGDVYAFSRAMAAKDGGIPAVGPELISISTATGVGTLVPTTFDFTTKGWSGAGVTTKVTVTVKPPPPPPPVPK